MGGLESHQIDHDTLNFAWNIALGVHLAWVDPEKLNSGKCCHFPPYTNPKIAKWTLLVDRTPIKLTATRLISRAQAVYSAPCMHLAWADPGILYIT
jgi:hypothetical protein